MDKTLRLPQFIIGGAPKCGTSSLYYWLSAHPEVCGSKVKEIFFFADEVNRFNESANCSKHGLESYANFFEHCPDGKKAFEATAHYIYYEKARKELLNLQSQPKIVFILREPSAQMYSHYRMVKYRIKTYRGDFKDYVEHPGFTFYVEYAEYLKQWLKEWPSERIKVMVFEDLVRHKRERMKELSTFLGIDSNFYSDFSFEHRNETVAIKSGGLHQLGLKLQKWIPHWVQRAILPVYLKINSSKLDGKSEEEKQILAEQKEKYQRVGEELQILLPDLDLSHWKK